MKVKVLSGIILLVLIVLGLIFFLPKKPATPAKNFITHVDNHLSPEQKTAYDKKIAEDQGKIAAGKKQNIPENELQSVYIDLGFYQYLEGNLLEAKDAYESAKALHAGAAVWVGLFPVLRDMGDIDGAEEAVKQAVTLNPSDWNMWREYITLEQYQRHATNDALDKLYKQALEGTHTGLNIVTVYAQFLERNMGDLQSALNYWKIALQQEPTNAAYKGEIARLQKLLGQ